MRRPDWKIAIVGGSIAALGLGGFAAAQGGGGGDDPAPDGIRLQQDASTSIPGLDSVVEVREASIASVDRSTASLASLASTSVASLTSVASTASVDSPASVQSLDSPDGVPAVAPAPAPAPAPADDSADSVMLGQPGLGAERRQPGLHRLIRPRPPSSERDATAWKTQPVARARDAQAPIRRWSSGIRVRVVLASVGLLLAALVAANVVVRQVLISRLDRQIEDALSQEVEELRQLAGGSDPSTGEPFGDDVAALLDTFLRRNVPADGEAFYTVVGGEPFLTSFDPPEALLDDPEVLARITEPPHHSGWTSTPMPARLVCWWCRSAPATRSSARSSWPSSPRTSVPRSTRRRASSPR
jgi:hypothetical protein